MERLTYDFALGGNHCWQVKGADNLECREVCERQGDGGCKTCPIAKAFDRLAAIEDILGDEYDLDRLSVLCNQRMTMRDEVSERFSLTAKIPLDRLRELVEADRDGRCVVVPCKPGDTVWRIVNDATPHITKDKCLTIMLDNGSMWVDLIDNGMNGLYFGQRLFRTRAEAEAALKAREQDG